MRGSVVPGPEGRVQSLLALSFLGRRRRQVGDRDRVVCGRPGCCPRDGVAEMPGDRLHRILAAFSAGGDVSSPAWLCGVCPGIAGVTGAGVMLMSGGIPRGSLCTSN